MQIDQLIAEDKINCYRRQRVDHTLFAASFRRYLEGVSRSANQSTASDAHRT